MPAICMFKGIVIYMYYADHKPAHFHARYQDYKATFTLEGDIIAGDFPIKERKLVAAWTVLHYEELQANWELLVRMEAPFQIDPIK